MKIKFWGVRGSTPTPERRNTRYGGNTPCIEVRLDNGTLIIFDCGTGLRALGKQLLREFGQQPIHAYIFLTHFHWDHIQGIPFFLPFYNRGNVFLFHSVMRQGADLEGAVEDQMSAPYFPVDMRAMSSAHHFFNLDESPIEVNGAVISSAPLNHPQGCVAYRVAADGGLFVLATDTEPGSPPHDQILRNFVRGADLLVYDAQYTPEQLQGEKRGWGHSSWLEGTNIAKEADVKRLVLFHHDPDSDDLFVDGLVERARQEFQHVVGAAEGMDIELPGGKHRRAPLAAAQDRRTEKRYHVELPVRLSWREDDGHFAQIEVVSKDVSASGIQLIGPPHLAEKGPLNLEMILPDEITHRGEVVLHFNAMPVRRIQHRNAGHVAIAARLFPLGEMTPAAVASIGRHKKS